MHITAHWDVKLYYTITNLHKLLDQTSLKGASDRPQNRRLRFSSDADIVRLTNAHIIIIIIIIKQYSLLVDWTKLKERSRPSWEYSFHCWLGNRKGL